MLRMIRITAQSEDALRTFSAVQMGEAQCDGLLDRTDQCVVGPCSRSLEPGGPGAVPKLGARSASSSYAVPRDFTHHGDRLTIVERQRRNRSHRRGLPSGCA